MRDVRLLLVMSFAFTVLASWALAQDRRVEFQGSKISIHMDKQPLGLVIRYLMEKYDIPIGFEQATLDREHNDYNFDTNTPSTGVKNLTSSDGRVQARLTTSHSFKGKSHLITVDSDNAVLEDVMNTIVRQMKNYTWVINNGVINIFPKRARDDRFEKLLEMKVLNFTVQKGQPVSAITTEIMALPEFKKFLLENNLHFSGLRGGSDTLVRAQYGRFLENDIRLSNVTFRQLLNEATKIKRGGWILKRKLYSRPEEEHIDIDI